MKKTTIKVGDKFKVICNKRDNDPDSTIKRWISAENGDIIVCNRADVLHEGYSFDCVNATRNNRIDNPCSQHINSLEAIALQLQRVRKNTKTTLENLNDQNIRL